MRIVHSRAIPLNSRQFHKAIEDLIQQRQDAKKAKDFARADAIRDELKQAGILIQDTREGTQWSREA